MERKVLIFRVSHQDDDHPDFKTLQFYKDFDSPGDAIKHLEDVEIQHEVFFDNNLKGQYLIIPGYVHKV